MLVSDVILDLAKVDLFTHQNWFLLFLVQGLLVVKFLGSIFNHNPSPGTVLQASGGVLSDVCRGSR